MFLKIYPPYKIFFAFLISFIIASIYNFLSISSAFFISFFLLLISDFKIKKNYKKIFFISFFLIFLCIFNIFTYGDNLLFKFYFLSIYKEGCVLSLKIFLKASSILFIFLSFISSMSISEIASSLERLKFPKKLNLILILSFMHIFFIKGEYKKLMKILQARGFIKKSNMHTYKTYAYLIGILFIRALKKGEITYKAMLCRGFNGTFPFYYEFGKNKISYCFASFMLFISFLLIYLEFFV